MDSKILDEIFETLTKNHVLTGEKSSDSTFDEIIKNIINFYEGIINPLPVNIYWLDTNLTVAGCNQNVLNMFHFKSLSEFKGLSYEEIAKLGHWSEQATEVFRQDSHEVMRTGKPKLNIEEPPIPLANGRVVYFLTSRVPIFDRQGKVVGIVGISVDITERKKAEEEAKIAKEKAEVASHTKSEFIANMNHDIRTPLASMIGMSEFIIEESQEANIREYAQDILRAGERLLEFANNILEMMQTDMSDTPNHKPVNLKQIGESLSELFNPSFFKKKLHFQFEYDEKIPSFLASSPSMIHRILLNLLGNAIKFTNENGELLLSMKYLKTEEEKVFVALSVKDTGIGIPADKQHLVFEPFTKLSASYQGRYKGNGLGLYSVKQLVEKLHGNIKLDSELGKGSTFTVTIPLLYNKNISAQSEENILDSNEFKTEFEKLNLSLPQEEKSPEIVSSSMLPASHQSQSRILIVEDDEIAGKVTSLRLKKLHCAVDWVTSGEKAISKAQETHYNLIYMDIGLPGKDGCEVTQEIRKSEKEKGQTPVPIIALTAHLNEAGKNKCLEAGLNLVVRKPISQTVMKEHLIQYLNYSDSVNDNDNKRLIPEHEESQEELVSLFRKEIQEMMPTIQKYYQTSNWGDFQFIIHKFNGSASYCNNQTLKIAISELENALISVQKDTALVSSCFNKFLSEINNFLS